MEMEPPQAKVEERLSTKAPSSFEMLRVRLLGLSMALRYPVDVVVLG
jgi:hypothetical protein